VHVSIDESPDSHQDFIVIPAELLGFSRLPRAHPAIWKGARNVKVVGDGANVVDPVMCVLVEPAWIIVIAAPFLAMRLDGVAVIVRGNNTVIERIAAGCFLLAVVPLRIVKISPIRSGVSSLIDPE